MKNIIYEIILLPFLFAISLFSRLLKKKRDVGLGPLPLINNVYHREAVIRAGYSAQTFVDEVYFITDEFDVRLDRLWISSISWLWKLLKPLIGFYWCVVNYRTVVIYFNGGPIGLNTRYIWRMEPLLFRIANVKLMILPYGSDVQDMTRSKNLLFKHAMATYNTKQSLNRNKITKMIDLWTRHGDYIVAGCEWVDYLYYWDDLALSHFSINLNSIEPHPVAISDDMFSKERPLRLLHAPNHMILKGSSYFIDAVNDLKDEGYHIELELIQNVSNKEIKERIAKADVVLDQLVVGWYAMFAIEAMASCKPVICYLRNDLMELYHSAGLLESFDAVPIINANPFSVKSKLKSILENPGSLVGRGKKGREFVRNHHSTEAISQLFKKGLDTIHPS